MLRIQHFDWVRGASWGSRGSPSMRSEVEERRLRARGKKRGAAGTVMKALKPRFCRGGPDFSYP